MQLLRLTATVACVIGRLRRVRSLCARNLTVVYFKKRVVLATVKYKMSFEQLRTALNLTFADRFF